jgi:hypothetical protein
MKDEGTLVRLAFALLLSSISHGLQAQGTVTEYGLYSKDRQLLEQTREIAIGPEVRFGFCFEAPVDTTEEAIMLTETLSHPPVVKDGIENGGYSMPRMFRVESKVARGCAGYVAKSAADLAPGVWRFTLSDGIVDLVVQEFLLR